MNRLRIILTPLFCAMLICFGMISNSMAQGGPGTANAIIPFNVSCTGVCVVIPYNQNNVAIMIHPETGNVRCKSGTISGTAPIAPTTSAGVEFVSGGYFSSGTSTPASVEWDCIPEAGGTVTISGTIESR